MRKSDVHSMSFGRVAAILPVTDVNRSLTFYCDVLGFSKTFQNGTPVGFVILHNGDAELHLTLQPNHKAAHFNIAHMMVGNVEQVYQQCIVNGIRIIKGLDDKDYGLRAFVMADPDGNRIDVGQTI